MNYETLQEEFRYKQAEEMQLQGNQGTQMSNIYNQCKIDNNTGNIHLKGSLQILDEYKNEQLINLQQSIPILQAAGILQVLKSVNEAKQKLGNGNNLTINSRLRFEAQFLYFLWNLIDQEETQYRELRQLIDILHQKKKNQIKYILMQIYTDEDKVQQFVKSWINLNANKQHIKGASRTNISLTHENNKENSNGHLLTEINSNKMNKSQELGSPIFENGKFGLKIGEVHPNQFTYTCQLSVDQEKDLISRLYKNDIYKNRQEQMKEREQQKQAEALKQCTFMPNIMKRAKSVNIRKQNNKINGFDKAINRIKAGTEKNQLSKEMREYKPIGQNYDKMRQKSINPPKFLQRKKKQQQRILFTISFDLGRHKMNVKIRQSDTEQSVAQRICKIYSLKKQFYEQIKEIVGNQLDSYYQEQKQIEIKDSTQQF